VRDEALTRIIDSKRVLTRPEELVAYAYDATEHRCLPKAVLRPVSEEEVMRIVRYAAEEGIAITARGAGTSLSGCAVPCEGGMVIDMNLMSSIKAVDEANRLATVEPGVVYGRLNEELSSRGLFFPPDPGSGSVCTIGGMVSTNASGIRAVKYGTTRDYVQRLRVVTGSGEVVELGNLAPKSSNGYDLIGLFVGSEGTLGVVTEITLRLKKRPTSFAAASVSFGSMEEAGRAVGGIIARGLDPSVLELMDEATLRVVKLYQDIEVEGKAVLLIEMDGFTEKAVKERLEEAVRICVATGAVKVKRALTGSERTALWRARRAAFPSLARYRPTLVLEDVTVPISRLPEMLGEIERISREHDIEIATFGHAGDGNLHPTMLVDSRNKVEMEQSKEAMEDLFRSALALGGTLTGEHGIGLSKKAYSRLEHGGAIEVMEQIKRVFDPKGIMNPGKGF